MHCLFKPGKSCATGQDGLKISPYILHAATKQRVVVGTVLPVPGDFRVETGAASMVKGLEVNVGSSLVSPDER